MSDYEATAYLSLEKLKVNLNSVFIYLGKTHARVSAVLGQDSTRVESAHEIFSRLTRTS